MERGKFLKTFADKLSRQEIINYNARKNMAENWRPQDVLKRINMLPELYYRAFAAISYLTGCRVSEVARIRGSDIETAFFEESKKTGQKPYLRIYIRRVEKRRDNDGKICITSFDNPIFKPFIDIIMEYLKKRKPGEDDFIFGDIKWKTKREYIDNNLRYKVYRYFIKNGGFNPHLLRHALASYIAHSYKKDLGKKGEKIPYDTIDILQDRLGVKDKRSLEKYIRDLHDEERAQIW